MFAATINESAHAGFAELAAALPGPPGRVESHFFSREKVVVARMRRVRRCAFSRQFLPQEPFKFGARNEFPAQRQAFQLATLDKAQNSFVTAPEFLGGLLRRECF
jgi:hypothetical protein